MTWPAAAAVHLPPWILGLLAVICVYLLVYAVIRRLGQRFERWLAGRRRGQ